MHLNISMNAGVEISVEFWKTYILAALVVSEFSIWYPLQLKPLGLKTWIVRWASWHQK